MLNHTAPRFKVILLHVWRTDYICRSIEDYRPRDFANYKLHYFEDETMTINKSILSITG